MTARTGEPLPLDGQPLRAQDTWSVRLPVRGEDITVSKQTVVRERVVVSRRRIQENARVEAMLRREELRTASGSVDVDEHVT